MVHSPSNLKRLLLIIGVAVWQQAVLPEHVQARTSPAPDIRSVGSKVTGPPSTLAPMLAKVLPAVVSIAVEGSEPAPQSDSIRDPALRRFLGLPDLPQHSGGRFKSLGSGVIIDARQGYVVTVNHVIEHAETIHITLADRRQLDAKLVGADPQTDIAVLKVDPDRLVALPFGDSKQLQVGDYAVALGNPFGIGQTATFGIISGLGRMGFGIEQYEDFIQTDASINPGDSGGALVDTMGQLIGINAALLSQTDGNVGIGFAIPVDVVDLIAQQIITTGKVSRGALGLVVQDITPSAARDMQIQMDAGAMVSQVNPESAAAKAGIENGDVVVEVDGEPITTGSQFRNAVGLKQPGDKIKLKILRHGNQRSVMALLEPPAPE